AFPSGFAIRSLSDYITAHPNAAIVNLDGHHGGVQALHGLSSASDSTTAGWTRSPSERTSTARAVRPTTARSPTISSSPSAVRDYLPTLPALREPAHVTLGAALGEREL